MYKLMLVEDDPVIAGQLADFLRSWNYEVVPVADYTAVLAEFSSRNAAIGAVRHQSAVL